MHKVECFRLLLFTIAFIGLIAMAIAVLKDHSVFNNAEIPITVGCIIAAAILPDGGGNENM